MPELSLHERAVFQVFLDCYEVGAWNWIGGELSPRQKESLKLEVAESFARGYGIAWTACFAKKVLICAQAFLQYDAKVLAARIENERFQREGAVN